MTLFDRGLKKGFGEDQKLNDGSMMQIAKVLRQGCLSVVAEKQRFPCEASVCDVMDVIVVNSMMCAQIYPLDAMFSTPEEIPDDIKA